MLDFKFIRHLSGPAGRDVGHGYQASLGYQATEILRVAPAHFPNSKYTDSQLTHAGFSPKVFALSRRGHQQRAQHPRQTATVELPSDNSSSTSPLRRPEISLPLPALDMSRAGFLNGLRFRDLSDRHVPPRFIARDRIVIVGLHYHDRGASLLFQSSQSRSQLLVSSRSHGMRAQTGRIRHEIDRNHGVDFSLITILISRSESSTAASAAQAAHAGE